MPHIASDIQPLLDDLRVRLQDLYGDRLADVILFGSVARGEATDESDVDVLVVLDGPVNHYAEQWQLADLSVDLLDAYGHLVSFVTMSAESLNDRDEPLSRAIHKEGVRL